MYVQTSNAKIINLRDLIEIYTASELLTVQHFRLWRKPTYGRPANLAGANVKSSLSGCRIILSIQEMQAFAKLKQSGRKIPQSVQISFTDLNSQFLGCLGEQHSSRNPSPETQAFLLLPLGKGGTPYGLNFDRDYCENATSPLGKGAKMAGTPPF